MSALRAVQAAVQAIHVAVSVEDSKLEAGGVRVKLLGFIPVYDSGWEGVKRRKARRAARRR